MMVGVGDTAPAFRLPSTGGGEHRLYHLDEEVAEGTTLLVFPPPATAAEEAALSLGEVDWFTLLDGLSPLIVADEAWFDRQSCFRDVQNTPVLVDVGRRAAEAYDVAASASAACHAFLVDGTRTVRGHWQGASVAEFDLFTLLEEAKRYTITAGAPAEELSP